MLPPLNQDGFLPEGVHDCTPDEVARRFACFQESDQRPRLWSHFKEFLKAATATGMIEELVLDGSFVTSKPNPNDIDIIVVISAEHRLSEGLRPDQYALLAQKRVRRRWGFDIVVVKNKSENLIHAIDFFSQVKQRPLLRKGLVRIKL